LNKFLIFLIFFIFFIFLMPIKNTFYKNIYYKNMSVVVPPVSNYGVLSVFDQGPPSVIINTKDIPLPVISNDLSDRPSSYKNVSDFIGETTEISRCTLSAFPVKRMIGKGKNGLIYELKGFAELEDEIMVKVMDDTIRNKWEVYYSKRLTNIVLRNRSPHFPMVWLDDQCEGECHFIDPNLFTDDEDRLKWTDIKEKSCYLMFLEKFDNSLDHLITLTKETLVSFVIQMMMAFSVLQGENLVHNDCHSGNVLIKRLVYYEETTPYIGYRMGTETIYVRHEDVIFALSDFGMMSQLDGDPPSYLPEWLKTNLDMTEEQIQSIQKSVHLDMAVLLKSFMKDKSLSEEVELDRMCRFFVKEALKGGKRYIASASVMIDVFGYVPFRTKASPGDVIQIYDYHLSDDTYGYSFIEEEQQLLEKEKDDEEVYRPKFKRDKSNSIIKGVLNVKILNRFLNECGLLFTKEDGEREVVRNVLRKIMMNGENIMIIMSLLKLLPSLPFNKDDKRKIASGAYGTIYEVDETSVGKMMIVDRAKPSMIESFLEENITHLLLYCLCENEKGMTNPFPRIKGIYKSGEKPFVIMEKLDSTSCHYFQTCDLTQQVNQLIVICYLLYDLQIKYGFTHGDMHCQNVMVTNQSLSIKIDMSEPDSVYVSESLTITLEKRPYFIDLGMTCAELTDEEDIYFATMVVPNGLYKKSNYYQCGNPSHDIRMLIASLMSYLNPVLQSFFRPKFKKYTIDQTKPFFWNFYDDVAHMNDPDFRPMSLINSLRFSFLPPPSPRI
jgi:hypothetical protein